MPSSVDFEAVTCGDSCEQLICSKLEWLFSTCINVILLSSKQLSFLNIAKGTTDPRVEFCLPK